MDRLCNRREEGKVMTFLEAARGLISQELDLYGADEEEINRLVNILINVKSEIIR